MSIRVGINGFGRIGQTLLRVVNSRPELGIEIVAINDLASAETLAYSLKKDSLRGDFPGTVVANKDSIVVNGRVIQIFSGAEPALIPWSQAGVDVVIESTGVFRSGEQARKHITSGGARKVIISASADAPDAFIVYGANQADYDPDKHDVVSPASCGVNALAMMSKVLLESFAVTSVSTTVILAAQGWQKIHDTVSNTSRQDPRLGRSMNLNIIPHLHVVGELLAVALPRLGIINFSYFVVPTPIGSMAMLTAKTDRPVSVDAVNRAMYEAAEGPLKGLLAYSEEPTVSSDSKGNPASCLFDATATQVTPDGGIKVMGWFDGEWGFSNRLADLVRMVSNNASVERG